jgi:hypothetical protein
MSGKRTADIVFCLDATVSMRPVYESVAAYVERLFLSAHGSLRVDFLAHGAVQGDGVVTHRFRTVAHPDTDSTVGSIYRAGGAGLFTTDPAAFRAGLERLPLVGDVSPLPALDAVLDFPWCPGNPRVVFFITDRIFDTTPEADAMRRRVRDVVLEIQRKKVTLFITAPGCDAFDELYSADKSRWFFPEDGSVFSEVELRDLFPSYGHDAPRRVPPGDVNPQFGQDAFHTRD